MAYHRRIFLLVTLSSLCLFYSSSTQTGLKELIIGGSCVGGTAIFYASGCMKNVLLCLTNSYNNDHYTLKKKGYKALKKNIIQSNGTSIISVFLGQQNYPLKTYRDNLQFSMAFLFLLKLPYLNSKSGKKLSKRLSKMCAMSRELSSDKDLYNELRQHENKEKQDEILKEVKANRR